MIQKSLYATPTHSEKGKNSYFSLKESELYASFINAKRIQEAILKPAEEVEKEMGNAFIYFQPKDIVSGDFYWTYRICDQMLFTVGDCSGHGIGGAFISILGYAGLKKVVMDRREVVPAEVLNELNKYFHSILMIDHTNYVGTMDISLCKLDMTTGDLQFAGAKNSIYVIRDTELIELKGEKHSIGDYTRQGVLEFQNQHFQLKKGDILYLFSDGYRDQLGGPKGRRVMNANFRQLLRSISTKPLGLQKIILHNFMKSWREDFFQTDDICVMGYKYE